MLLFAPTRQYPKHCFWLPILLWYFTPLSFAQTSTGIYRNLPPSPYPSWSFELTPVSPYCPEHANLDIGDGYDPEPEGWKLSATQLHPTDPTVYPYRYSADWVHECGNFDGTISSDPYAGVHLEHWFFGHEFPITQQDFLSTAIGTQLALCSENLLCAATSYKHRVDTLIQKHLLPYEEVHIGERWPYQHSGSEQNAGLAGVHAMDATSNYSEYLMAFFPGLEAGKSYYVAFVFSLADQSTDFSNRFGIRFTDIIPNYGENSPINNFIDDPTLNTPVDSSFNLISSLGASRHVGMYETDWKALSDTSEWRVIQGCIQMPEERPLPIAVIGSFGSAVPIEKMGRQPGENKYEQNIDLNYYYVDDFVLIELDKGCSSPGDITADPKWVKPCTEEPECDAFWAQMFDSQRQGDNSEHGNLQLAFEGSSSDDFAVYPNPTGTEKLNVRISGLEDISVARVYGLDGSLLLEQPIADGKNALDISELKNGTYVLRVANNHAVRQKRFVIAR